MKPQAQKTTQNGSAPENADTAESSDSFNPYRHGFVALSKNLFDSSLLELPVVARWVFIGLLAQSGVDGIVYGTDESLARRFHVPLEEFQAAIDLLESPDPASTTKQHEGRRVLRKPCNTFRVINRKIYLKKLQNPSSALKSSNRSKSNIKGEIRNSTTGAISTTTYNRHTTGHTTSTTGRAISTTSTITTDLNKHEKSRLAALTETQQAAFWLFRGFSETANQGEFYISQNFAARQIGITQQAVSKIIQQFRDSGILERAYDYAVREGKAARYRWTANEAPTSDNPQPDDPSPDDDIPF
jgi:hypothetical protein